MRCRYCDPPRLVAKEVSESCRSSDKPLGFDRFSGLRWMHSRPFLEQKTAREEVLY